MKDNKIDIHNIAVQYFEGRIAREDEILLFSYIQKNNENLILFRQWEKEWKGTGYENADVSREWSLLQNRLRVREVVVPVIKMPKLNIWKRVAAVAAVAVILLSTTWGVLEWMRKSVNETYFTCVADKGEKSKMMLSDGTVVWLNSGSSLRYSDKFGQKNRVVELSGEGYFEVAKQNGLSFFVKTYACEVEVKGTKFNVLAYPEDSVITTTLIEGAVDLLYGNKSLSIVPGESVKYNVQSNIISTVQVNANQYRSWAENRIEYDDITLQELVDRLSRQYDVNIQLEPGTSGKEKFRISLRNRETISEVLTALSEIIPVKVRYKEKDIYIRKNQIHF